VLRVTQPLPSNGDLSGSTVLALSKYHSTALAEAGGYRHFLHGLISDPEDNTALLP
jgi:hypothetical protein